MNNKTVLFIDDDDQLLNVLSLRTRKMGLNVVTAHNLFTALSVLNQTPPDVVCVDVKMPSGNGLSMCQMIKSELNGKSIPMIVLTGCTDSETINTCERLNARYIKKGAEAWQTVESTLCEMLDWKSPANSELTEMPAPELTETPTSEMPTSEAPTSEVGQTPGIVDAVFEMLGAGMDRFGDFNSEESPMPQSSNREEAGTETWDSKSSGDATSAEWAASRPWVLLIEDDQDVSLALKLRLEKKGIAVARAFEGLDGVKEAFSRPAEAIILDFNLPNGQGDYVLRRLKANPLTKDIPVIVVTGVRDQSLQQKMLSLGASQFFTKPVNSDVLIQEIQKYIEMRPAGAC